MDERKLKILAAVVDEYILTGEPVGSKAISKVPGINVSAATIRNDMAMLEQLGYLEQPHTSAGRIPTFNGYRLYIDKLMTVETLSESERQRLDDMLGPEENLTEDMRSRMIQCDWLEGISTSFSAELSIACTNRNGILADVIGVVSEQKLNLLATNARALKDKTALIDITIEVSSKEQIDLIIRKLHRVPGVYEIKRKVQ